MPLAEFDPTNTFRFSNMPNDPRPEASDDDDDKRSTYHHKPYQPRNPVRPQRPAVGPRCTGPAAVELTQLQKTKADIVAKVWTESGIPYPAPSPEFFVGLLERSGAGMALVSRAIRSTAVQLKSEAEGTSRKRYIRDAASCARFLSGKVNKFVEIDAQGTAA